MKEEVKLSIVIPAHDEEDSIERCVKACLDQALVPYEIIVVNDGSTDKTRKIVERLAKDNKNLKLLNFASAHSAAFSRNRGAEFANGDVILFIDADAIIEDRLLVQKIVDKFKDKEINAAVCTVVGEYKTFIQKCQLVRAIMSSIYLKTAKVRLEYVNCIRKKVFKEMRGFDEEIFYYEDREFGERVNKKYKINTIPTKIVHNDPSTFWETIRQARYVGKGVASYNWVLKNPLALLYPGYPFFWLIFAALIFLVFFNRLFLYIVATLFLILLIETAIAYYYSKMFLPSLFFVFFLSPLRATIIVYSFLRVRIKGLFSAKIN